jgi:hypothetical protein
MRLRLASYVSVRPKKERFPATSGRSDGTKSRVVPLRRARTPLSKVAEFGGVVVAPHGYLVAWIYVRIAPALSLISQLRAEVLLAASDGRILVPESVEQKQWLRRKRSIQ